MKKTIIKFVLLFIFITVLTACKPDKATISSDSNSSLPTTNSTVSFGNITDPVTTKKPELQRAQQEFYLEVENFSKADISEIRLDIYSAIYRDPKEARSLWDELPSHDGYPPTDILYIVEEKEAVLTDADEIKKWQSLLMKIKITPEPMDAHIGSADLKDFTITFVSNNKTVEFYEYRESYQHFIKNDRCQLAITNYAEIQNELTQLLDAAEKAAVVVTEVRE
jgi:hypothetical protein